MVWEREMRRDGSEQYYWRDTETGEERSTDPAIEEQRKIDNPAKSASDVATENRLAGVENKYWTSLSGTIKNQRDLTEAQANWAKLYNAVVGGQTYEQAYTDIVYPWMDNTNQRNTPQRDRGAETKNKLDQALAGGIIDKATYDKYMGISNTGQYDIVDTQLAQDTTNFLRGDIDTGAPDLSTFKAPEFSPEQVQTWYDSLSKMEAPLEKEQVNKIGEYYNATNPFTRGSGTEIKATNEMLAQTIADRYGRAMGIGQQEYEKKYNVALQDWENKYNDYWKRVQRDWGQQDYSTQRANYTQDLNTRRGQDLQDIASQYQRQTNDAYRGRDWANQDWNKQASLAEQMARMARPADKGWEQYLSPILTGAGYAFGGKLGGMAATGLGKMF